MLLFQVLYEQSCDDIDTWMNDLEKQIESGDTGMDLASVNILMQKQQASIFSSFLLRVGYLLECGIEYVKSNLTTCFLRNV